MMTVIWCFCDAGARRVRSWWRESTSRCCCIQVVLLLNLLPRYMLSENARSLPVKTDFSTNIAKLTSRANDRKDKSSG